jgi:hypothetical protein
VHRVAGNCLDRHPLGRVGEFAERRLDVADEVVQVRQQIPTVDTRAKWGWFLDYFNEFVQVRTSHIPDVAVQPVAIEDDEMDPVATWNHLRSDLLRRRSDE